MHYDARDKDSFFPEFGRVDKQDFWFRLIKIKEDGGNQVFAFESAKFPGNYIEDPGRSDVADIKLKPVRDIKNAEEKFYFNFKNYGSTPVITGA